MNAWELVDVQNLPSMLHRLLQGRGRRWLMRVSVPRCERRVDTGSISQRGAGLRPTLASSNMAANRWVHSRVSGHPLPCFAPYFLLEPFTCSCHCGLH